jgi:hypothetical protein
MYMHSNKQPVIIDPLGIRRKNMIYIGYHNTKIDSIRSYTDYIPDYIPGSSVEEVCPVDVCFLQSMQCRFTLY